MLNIFWDESFLNALITKRLYLFVVAWQSIVAPPFRPFFPFLPDNGISGDFIVSNN